MRIMGIDPGLRLTGYACVDCPEPGEGGANVEASGVGVARRRTGLEVPGTGVLEGGLSLIEAGVFRLKQKTSVADRLLELETDLVEALGRLRPSVVAVEKVFAHYKHPTTAAIMGHARGVILLCARRAEMRLVELASTEVKKSLTGNGHASKGQMQGAVAAQLGLVTRPEPADVADAIAIALCCGRRMLSRHEEALSGV